MAPTSCSAGLREGSSSTVGSASAGGGVSMIPLRDMNMSMSNPSTGLAVERKRARRGQKATKSTAARSTAGVEGVPLPRGGILVVEALGFASRRPAFSLSLFPIKVVSPDVFGFLLSPSIASVVSRTTPVMVSVVGSCFDLHRVVVQKIDGRDTVIGGNNFRHDDRLCGMRDVNNPVFGVFAKPSVAKGNNKRQPIDKSAICRTNFTREREAVTRRLQYMWSKESPPVSTVSPVQGLEILFL